MTGLSRAALRRAHRCDEATCVTALAGELAQTRAAPDATMAMARKLVEAVREQRSGASGVDHLMQEFSLSSQEGIALMCLAEALLRIPDKATVDRLIRDKIGRGDWQSHLGSSPSPFVNAATWGLMLTGKLVASHNHAGLGQALSRTLAKGGEPLIRKGVDFAMRLLGQQFVMGETIADALKRSEANARRGYTHSFDMLGEAALTQADADRYFSAYATAIHAIGAASDGRGPVAGPGISVKLSALHPRYTRSQKARVFDELGPRLRQLMLLAKGHDISLNIDAEESERLELSLDLLALLAADPALAGWDGLGFVVQAYQKRGAAVIDLLVDLARRNRRRLMVRLVKGAYWDAEIKRTQIDGLADYPVFTRKHHSDLSYLVCAHRLLSAPDAVYPQFATHNAHTLAAVMQAARERRIDDFEFQCLHGMGEQLYDNVIGADRLGQRCRIYAPVGTHETLLPYLVRRLLENGANSSFVHRLVDPAVSIAELIEDPLDKLQREGGTRHPAIPLPRDLFGAQRVNSMGLDLADETVLAGLEAELSALADRQWQAQPMLPAPHRSASTPLPVLNPARRQDRVGTVCEADLATVEQALQQAEHAALRWQRTPPDERAAALLRTADLLEARRTQLLGLCIREAGKSWGNAVAELREAVDFCRYYAVQLRSAHGNFPAHTAHTAHTAGPVVCISPWNFPLAIFVGQISAALAAGSPVIAKPAEQTPLIACLAVSLFHAAGIPADVLQCLPGRGETVGAALTADPRVAGVVFTGSHAVARLINQATAARPGVRLVAETGGQNAMIVDSTALPEQVVQDVMLSGFDSAGQRCSALRVLCLQGDIADHVLGMLKAAMAELSIGDPARFATDVGPVIDADAHAGLLEHIGRMRARGRRIHQLPLPAGCSAGCFVPPTLIEIESLAELQHEVFGPVVHVLRFAGDELGRLVEAINAMGFGLTLGLQSRIDETIDRVAAGARVGNLYVNRNIIGAVVGVQPFGGEGLSGTGPKAGGPLYLPRLADCEAVTAADIGCTTVAPPHDADAPLRRLAAWAAASGQQALAGWCARYASTSLRHASIALPGPTGETNTQTFAGRGRMLCLASDEAALLHQLAALFATDNRAVLGDNMVSRLLLGSLPPELRGAIGLQAAGDYSGLAGVLCDADDGVATAIARQLAASPGALIPLFRPGRQSGLYPAYRMLAERVLTVNTTAAGGNTTLMAMGA